MNSSSPIAPGRPSSDELEEMEELKRPAPKCPAPPASMETNESTMTTLGWKRSTSAVIRASTATNSPFSMSALTLRTWTVDPTSSGRKKVKCCW